MFKSVKHHQEIFVNVGAESDITKINFINIALIRVNVYFGNEFVYVDVL